MTNDDGIDDTAQVTKPAPSDEGAVERSETEGETTPRIVKLGDVATIRRDVVDPGEVDATTTYLGLEDIERGGRILQYRHVADSRLTSSKFTFSKTDLLYGKLRPNLGKIAKPECDGICSTDILPIAPGESLHRDFLGYYLSQPRMVAFAASRTSGANLPRISPKTLLQIPVPLPPLVEQCRIVSILDRADAIRTKRRQVLAAYDALPRSLFAEMFGGLKAEKRVSDVVERMRTGPFGSDLHHDEFVDSGISVLGLDNVVGNTFRWVQRRYITPEKYESLKRYTVYPGDVLVSIMGTAGRCVVVPDDIPTAINTKHICAITVNRDVLNPVFLRAVFLWHREARIHLLRSVKGSIMDGLNMGIIKKMPVILPPLALQREFAERVAAIEASRRKVERALALDDELFASLQSRAFRGEL
ncbi:restriction endonuclease subunit S [Bifidobacterium catulorum]|uniref:Restriction endonuclease subunit S n=1 Tax=Bifidobacterium catulorum TaxID=1630173 RepID=A0A2U2MQ12_9BIFI|nr:restriction endonuclease subunit S [Bifidobacterium catulorum]PWG58931.1 restriction endonuclease subunit S [Bifidobacterium catulorum]